MSAASELGLHIGLHAGDVIREEGNVFGGAVNIAAQDVCPDATVAHGELPTDPLTVGLVLLALDIEPLNRAPSSDRCAEIRASALSS